MTALAIAIWQVCKRKKNLSTLFKVAPEIKDPVSSNLGGLMSSLKSLLSNSSNPPADVEAPILETSIAANAPTTLDASSLVPALPPHNQIPPLPMLIPSPDFLTPNIVEKLFQIYQHLPA